MAPHQAHRRKNHLRAIIFDQIILRHQRDLKLSHGDDFCADEEPVAEAFNRHKNHLRVIILGQIHCMKLQNTISCKSQYFINSRGCT